MTPLHKKILDLAKFDEAQDIREQGEVYLRSARLLPIISSLLEANQRLDRALHLYARKDNWTRSGRMNNYILKPTDSDDLSEHIEDDVLTIAGATARAALTANADLLERLANLDAKLADVRGAE